MGTFRKDDNFKVTPIKVGPPIGGVLEIAQSARSAGAFVRLCPTGTITTVTSARQLTLSAVRADVANGVFDDWKLRINDEGYGQTREILELKDNVCKFQTPLNHHDQFPANLPYILIPFMLFTPKIFLLQGGGGPDVELWYYPEDYGTPTTSNAQRIAILKLGQGIEYPYDHIDKLFYRYPSAGTGVSRLMWGETCLLETKA